MMQLVMVLLAMRASLAAPPVVTFAPAFSDNAVLQVRHEFCGGWPATVAKLLSVRVRARFSPPIFPCPLLIPRYTPSRMRHSAEGAVRRCTER